MMGSHHGVAIPSWAAIEASRTTQKCKVACETRTKDNVVRVAGRMKVSQSAARDQEYLYLVINTAVLEYSSKGKSCTVAPSPALAYARICIQIVVLQDKIDAVGHICSA